VSQPPSASRCWGRFYERFADHAVEVAGLSSWSPAPTERRTPGRPPGPWRSRSLRRPKRRTARDLPTPLDPAPGWLDLWPGRVLLGSATPSASPSRLGVSARPRCSPRSQSPRARPPSPRGQRLVLSVSAKAVGRETSTPWIPMVGADAASGSTGWKIPAPARGFVHTCSHFL
jgi:hypothetical protein